MSDHPSKKNCTEYKGAAQNLVIGFVSGALLSSIKSCAREKTQSKNIKNGFKAAVQSAVATASMARANHKMRYGDYASGVLSLAMGAIAIYAIEKKYVTDAQRQNKKRGKK